MEIRTLTGTSHETLVSTFLRAFEGYFVQMPTDPAIWRDRWGSAPVDPARSYGAFNGEELVAFILHAIGTVNGVRTAYNSGTGVLPAYRGQHLIDTLYARAIPALREAGVAACSL